MRVGRWCEIHGEAEERELEVGFDFRLPIYRREVFLRFYEFHIKYGTHPGLVYMLMPWLAEREGWDDEAKLWFAFLNGNTQNPLTSWVIFRAFPNLRTLDAARLRSWFKENYAKLAFDTDRRYHKKSLVQAVESYRRLTGGEQVAYFRTVMRGEPAANFDATWEAVRAGFPTFGRLSAFSYIEYLAVMGQPVRCSNLFLGDRSGSRSHRNGLCKVLGRDDLDWHESNPGFDGDYSPFLLWLESEAALLLAEAEARIKHPDVGYFTLESALCTYKSWHRPNRRYPNVYADMLVGRIEAAELAWRERFKLFWEAREARLPEALRLECNPADPGNHPTKQNHYRLTGEVVVMDCDWPCFENEFGRSVRRFQRKA